jgi:hypothetical protein
VTSTIRVIAEYGSFPLWADTGEDIDPRDLLISDELATEFDEWRAAFDATLDRGYPPDSEFPTPAAEEEFIERGERLARRLAAELGTEYQVRYFYIRTGSFIDIEPAAPADGTSDETV